MKKITVLKGFLMIWVGLYIFIYGFPFPLDNIPFTYELFSKYFIQLKTSFILFFGKSILGIETLEKIEMTGSGDTTFDYVMIPAMMIVSFVIGLIMISIKKVRENASGFYKWSLVYARYFVGLTLISYGVAKFLVGQFPGPSLYSMDVLYGEMSPMGLAWRFFGYSDTYKIFMGISEILAGFLLLFRRTVVLGALGSIAVCTNIVLVNFSFDVPVKLFSSHLLVFSILVLLPSLKAIFDFFLLQKTTSLGELKPYFTKRKYQIIWLLINIYYVGVIPITRMVGHYQGQKFRVHQNEWEGIYSGFEADEAIAWDKVVVESNYLMLIRKDGEREFLSIQEINPDGKISIKNLENEEEPDELSIRELSDQEYELELRIGENISKVNGTRKLVSEYPLVARGFHWINEYPYNR